ncbi:MAG: hypothetical protein E6I35_02255 [Chloroflexi bacterium]|nr:MAG: hypothetical protein E6I35_02255 [Chloroflexota bacterium]
MQSERTWHGKAPGRVNLIGEHVDYLGGVVLPAAVDRFTEGWGSPAAEWSIESDVPGGLRYAQAIGDELGVGPQAVHVASQVPPNAGISSSAALLVALASGLQPGMDGKQAALACQRAEQKATGVQVGVMDQFASALGRRGCALLLDCATLEYEVVPFPDEVAIAVIDSGEHRSLASTPYNQRRREAESGDPKRRKHVDYLGGVVLPAAVDRFTEGWGSPAAEWSIESDVPGGLRYAQAIGDELGVGPQAVHIASQVPPNAGISSSAALLVALASGLQPGMDGKQAALACQRAEQKATGVQVGVMDQFASALGRRGCALLLDCATLEYEVVPFPDEVAIRRVPRHQRVAERAAARFALRLLRAVWFRPDAISQSGEPARHLLRVTDRDAA